MRKPQTKLTASVQGTEPVNVKPNEKGSKKVNLIDFNDLLKENNLLKKELKFRHRHNFDFCLDHLKPEFLHMSINGSSNEDGFFNISNTQSVKDFKQGILEAYFIVANDEIVCKDVLMTLQYLHYMFSNIEQAYHLQVTKEFQ